MDRKVAKKFGVQNDRVVQCREQVFLSSARSLLLECRGLSWLGEEGVGERTV
jgi:hypothetical protein